MYSPPVTGSSFFNFTAGIDPSSKERNVQPPGRVSDDDGTYPAPAGAAPPSAEYMASFVLPMRQQTAGMAVGPTPGAATPADTTVGASRGREWNNASIRGPHDGDVSVADDC